MIGFVVGVKPPTRLNPNNTYGKRSENGDTFDCFKRRGRLDGPAVRAMTDNTHPPPDEVLATISELFARNEGAREPMAAVLATADEHGRPAARTVLLKTIDRRGFTFFTNMGSRKGRQLAANPRAALCVYFQSAHKQAQIEGDVIKTDAAEDDAYWRTRARASQIGAWASRQSEPLPAREDLLARVSRYQKQFHARPVPRPPFWGGYRIRPTRIELWRGHPDRLNERVRYEQAAAGEWVKYFVYP